MNICVTPFSIAIDIARPAKQGGHEGIGSLLPIPDSFLLSHFIFNFIVDMFFSFALICVERDKDFILFIPKGLFIELYIYIFLCCFS